MPISLIQFSNFDTSIRNLSFDDGANAVTLGNGSYITDADVSFDSKMHILVGNYSSLAHYIHFIIGLNHDAKRVSTYPFRESGKWCDNYPKISTGKHQVMIGHDVWIGAQVTIMGGVHIGNGAIIGANTMVASDIPPYAVAVGNPAKVIKYRFSQDIIDKLRIIKWWNWSIDKIQDALPLMGNIEKFLDVYYEEPIYDEETQLITDVAKLHQNYKLYHLRPDLYGEQVWRIFLQRYVERYSYDDKCILVLWFDRTLNAKICVNEVKKVLAKKGGDAPGVMIYQGNMSDMCSIINYMDVIVTTKDMSSLDIIDSVVSKEVNIMYVYDEFCI